VGCGRRVGGRLWRLVPCGGGGDPLAAWFRGHGRAEPGRRADQALGPRGRSLDGPPRLEQRRGETTATLGPRFRPDTMRLRAVALDVFAAPGRHARPVGTPPLTDGLIRGAHCMGESRQGAQPPRRDRPATAVGALGDTAGTTALEGLEHRGPRQRLGPWADGMGLGDAVGTLEAGTIAAEPMLPVADSTHRESSCWMGSTGAGYTHTRHLTSTSRRRGEQMSDHYLEAIRQLLSIFAKFSRNRPAVMESRAGTWSKSVFISCQHEMNIADVNHRHT
jgi:hypothetical protein